METRHRQVRKVTFSKNEVEKVLEIIKKHCLRFVRVNLAEIRSQVNPKYAAQIDSGEIEKKFESFYISKLSSIHTPESILTETEKNTIRKTVRNLVVKDERH